MILACRAPLAADPAGIIEAPYQPDYAKGMPERQLWREVREKFLRSEYPRILKRQNLRLNCGTCTTIYADFELSISLTGEPTIRNLVVAKACGRPMGKMLRADFSRYLENYPYKPGLYGTTVRLRLGTGLKC